jgi:hypothetical protein
MTIDPALVINAIALTISLSFCFLAYREWRK